MPDLIALDAALAAALPAGSLYAVGGRVRDEIRAAGEGVPFKQKDLDYVVVGVTLADLIARLGALGKIDVVGASFAVVKVTMEGTTLDVALPRRERSTGVGHRDFEVQGGPEVPLADDLARRDFRMNMIARAIPSGELVDPYGGAADIAAHRVDLLRDEAFAEDPLRMLRACQFAARFGYVLSERTRQALHAGADLITTVTPERIGDELVKLFRLAPQPSTGLELLRESGLLAHLWPELLEGVGVEQNEWHAYDVYRHTLATLDATPPGDLTLRLAALLHDVGKPRTKEGPRFYRHEHVGADLVRAMLERFRFPNETVEAVAHLVRQHMFSSDPELSPGAIRRFIRRVGPEHVERLFALRMADVTGSGLPKRDGRNEAFAARVAAIIEERPPFTVRDLAIGGEEIIALLRERGLVGAEFRGDARVGALLGAILERVLDDPELNDVERLKELAAELVA